MKIAALLLTFCAAIYSLESNGSASLKVEIDGLDKLTKQQLIDKVNSLFAEKLILERSIEKRLLALKNENDELKAMLNLAREELSKQTPVK